MQFAAFLAVAVPSGLVHAQAVNNGFAGFASDSNEPIDIESDTLEVQDAKKIAIFRGNVKAVQGDMTLRSKALHVSYAGDSGLQGGGSEITENPR